MHPVVTLTSREQEIQHLVLLLTGLSTLPSGIFSAEEKRYLTREREERKHDMVSFNRLDHWVFVCFVSPEMAAAKRLEECRKLGDRVACTLNEHHAESVVVFDVEGDGPGITALAEGIALGSYEFLKYKTSPAKRNTMARIELYAGAVSEKEVKNLNSVIGAVWECRTLVNEPNSHLTAAAFSDAVTRLAGSCGATAEVFNKSKIQALKMGGLLGVNKGSHEPPTFTVMEWKPKGAVNRKPICLVGKGVVYDTGGMNLKPGDSMNNMKDDMAGAAAVASAIHAIASARLPVHVVGLMPATDNRPGAKALVSGDIITMHSGATVEVINTDAEGRLILADALSYARRYDPMLVIDLATLTGAAVRAIGKYGAVALQSGAASELQQLKACGDAVYERLVEFPMWEEYGELIKSDLADMKNLGPPEGGMITAAKFLEKFIAYPFIHLDIAGPAFIEKRDSYRGTGGTGFGVRLLFEFVRSVAGA